MTQKDDTSFPLRTYGKSELALLYFPTAQSAHTAVNHLMSWIRRYKGLLQTLEAMDYRKSAKCFTPKEVADIVRCLGEP